jgi:hypothetical protein
MAKQLQLIDSTCGRKNLTNVNATLAGKTAEMRGIRRDVQKVKFAILLGKKWFDEATDNHDEATVEVNGYTVTFAVRVVQVPV